MDPAHISLSEQMSIFRNQMNSLLIEKKSADIIEERRSVISKQAKEILLPKGDDKFNKTVEDYIDSISSLRPGRKLLKALIKNNNKIEIIQSKKSVAFPFSNSINLKIVKNHPYNTVGNKYSKSPSWVILAHELIHKLHYFPVSEGGQKEKNYDNLLQSKYIDYIMFDNPEPNSNSFGDIKVNILKNMSCLEEQHAITGYNHLLFNFGDLIKPIDVICENAFLLALNLPYRINHLEGRKIEKYNEEIQTPDSYYNWLEKEIGSLRTIPEEYENKQSLATFLAANPLALLSLPEHLKNDLFFLETVFNALNRKEELFKYFPNLTKNEAFILNITELHGHNLKFTDPELLNKKEFIIKVLDNIKKRGNFKDIKEFIAMINPSLQNDPELKIDNKDILNILSKVSYSAYSLPSKFLREKSFVLEIFNIIKEHKNDSIINSIFRKLDVSLKNDHDIIATHQACLLYAQQ